LEELADDEVIVVEKDGTERIEKKMKYDTLIVQ
jgi:protein-L-isoaspartate O-methyltransferase